MKKLAAILTALVMAVFAGAALADGAEITVSGTGEILVTADTAVISLGVTARDTDVIQAQSKANAIIADIRALLTQNGLEEEQISTDYINIYPIYEYRDDEEKLTAYSASSTLAIKVTDMEMVGPVIDRAFEAGANTLNGISFSCSDTTEARAQALQAAVVDAKAKAEVLAAASGLTLGKIEDIREANTFSYDSGANNFSVKASGNAMDKGTVVRAAKLVVSASVNITWKAE